MTEFKKEAKSKNRLWGNHNKLRKPIIIHQLSRKSHSTSRAGIRGGKTEYLVCTEHFAHVWNYSESH